MSAFNIRRLRIRQLLVAMILVTPFCHCSNSSAQEPGWTEPGWTEPGWTGRIIKVEVDKEISDATPILLRPYRPLHFYGNTVRRAHYRGNPFVTPRDLVDATYAWIHCR